MTDYANLEIRILKRDGQGYSVELTLDGQQQFQGGYLEADLLPWVPTGNPVKDGESLFELLFNHDQLKRDWADIRGRKSRRRIRLRIDATDSELHAVPWELLRDTTRPDQTPQTLAADGETPFSRYLAGRWETGEPVSERPVKLLVSIANPDNLAEYNSLKPIDVEREKATLEEALAEIDPAHLTVEFLAAPVTLSALATALKGGYHLLHIVAHGYASRRREEAVLYLADPDNQVALVGETKLAGMIRQQTQRPHFILLASCHGATRSPADAFRGLAPRLIEAGTPAVLAMQDAVKVKTTRAFSGTFYRQLLSHGLVDLASNEARSALLAAGLPGSSIPALFSRLPDNRLLTDPAALGTANIRAFMYGKTSNFYQFLLLPELILAIFDILDQRGKLKKKLRFGNQEIVAYNF